MNLGELVTATERRAGVAYDRDGTIDAINEALQAISKVRDWGWLETTWSTTSVGAATFTPPTAWAKVRSVTVGSRSLPMVPATLIDADPHAYGWAMENDRLLISPTPASGVAVVARIFTTEPTLTAEDDTPLLPAEWHRGLIDYAASILLERAGDDKRADRCMARFNDVRKQMIQQASRVEGPHRVRVRPGSPL